jgi:uncharacterized membrane protein YraQ (UPF0718 family)
MQTLSEVVKSPVRRGSRHKSALIWSAVIVVAAMLCWHLRGPAAVEAAFSNYVDQIGVVAPRMLAAILISGFIQVLIPRALVTQWLGAGAGAKGFFVAAGVGALTPGGPMLAFPLVLVLRNAGASTTSLIVFLTAWATLGFHRILMWELPLLGPEFALVRYLSSVPLPFAAGLLAIACTRLAARRQEAQP